MPVRRDGRGRIPAVGTASGCARARSIRRKSSWPIGAGRSCFNSASNSKKSFMGLQGLPERAKRVAIARGGGVRRNFQDGRDLGEGEFVPDFQDDYLPLFVRQPIHRSGEELLTFVGD